MAAALTAAKGAATYKELSEASRDLRQSEIPVDVPGVAAWTAEELTTGTMSGWLRAGPRGPLPTTNKLLTFLLVTGVEQAHWREWLAAVQRVRSLPAGREPAPVAAAFSRRFIWISGSLVILFLVCMVGLALLLLASGTRGSEEATVWVLPTTIIGVAIAALTLVVSWRDRRPNEATAAVPSEARYRAEEQNVTHTKFSGHTVLRGLGRLTPRQKILAAVAVVSIPFVVVVVLVVAIAGSATTVTAGTSPVTSTPAHDSEITIPVGAGPRGVGVTPDGRHAYVPNLGSSNVSVIDTIRDAVTATIPIGPKPGGVAVTPDGRHAYATSHGSDNVFVIDTASNAVTTTISVGTSPDGVAIATNGRDAYVANQTSGTVSVIDTATNTVTATIPVSPSPLGVAVTPDGRHVYVTHYYGSGTVSVIDTATHTVTTSIPVGTEPLGVAVDPDGRRVYVTNDGSGTVSVIDTATNTVSATIPVGPSTGEVAVTPDGRHAYVPNFGADHVSVIDTVRNIVTATIPVGTGPLAVAVTQDGRRAYVANYGSNNVSVIEIGTG